MKDSVFYNLFNSNLLFYSWNQLKANKFLFFPFSQNAKIPPFSNHWFKKTALLIKKGNYKYTNTNVKRFIIYNKKNHFTNILGQMIIELSFVNIILYCKQKSLLFDLVQCLRY